MVAFFIYIAFMFSTPTIPTDSLYKFLFVGGIVLMLASAYFGNQYFITFVGFQSKYDSIRVEKFLKVSNVINKMNSLNKKNQIKNVDTTKAYDFDFSILKNNDKKLTDLNGNIFLYSLYITFVIGIFFVGLIATIFGYFTWKKFIQSPQDRILQIQLETAELDLKLKKNYLEKKTSTNNPFNQDNKK